METPKLVVTLLEGVMEPDLAALQARLGPTGPPSAPPGWKVGRNQTLAAWHRGSWSRGVVVRKTEEQ